MPTVRPNAPIAPVIGQGLYSTRWKGCRTITSFRLSNLITWKVIVLNYTKEVIGGMANSIILSFNSLELIPMNLNSQVHSHSDYITLTTLTLLI